MTDEVSIVIPTYNASAFIADTLASIFAQTQLPAEIVVVDDCSPDETQAQVNEIARSAPIPLCLISLPRNSGGASRPLNVGIHAAKADLIALLDQDDLMRPRRIERQLKALFAFPQCSITIGRFSILGQEEDEMSPMWPVSQLHDFEGHIDLTRECFAIDSKMAFKPLLSRNYAGSCSNFCFTKQWWRRIGKFDETVRTCTDLDFMLRAAIAGPVAFVNEVLFDYRWSRTSLQHRDFTKSLLEATMVRLRAASLKPDWAADELEVLRDSALSEGAARIRKGDLLAVKSIVETIALHKGAHALRQKLNNKANRLVKFLKK